MKKNTRSILQELNNLHVVRNKSDLIATSGNNLIESAINLLKQINEQYDPDQALELERRFINSIKNGDPRKFKRAITRINEGRNDEE